MGLSAHAFQVTEMCEIFGGERVKVIYDGVIALYIFCTLWGYSTVFGAAMAAHLTPGGLPEEVGYVVYVALFAAVVVPLSCMDVKEQVAFQVFMTFLRFLVVVTMLTTIGYAVLRPESAAFGLSDDHDWQPPLVRWAGLFEVLPAVIFATMLNSSVPVVVSALDRKHAIGRVISVGMTFTFCTYLLLGTLVAAYFGTDVDASCNVNWAALGATGG
ncbi:unnamed protein product, partial [Phaeothamnion confervicola]